MCLDAHGADNAQCSLCVVLFLAMLVKSSTHQSWRDYGRYIYKQRLPEHFFINTDESNGCHRALAALVIKQIIDCKIFHCLLTSDVVNYYEKNILTRKCD